MALEFTDSNFQTDVLQSDKLTVVDFWAEWCGPCRMMEPVIEQLAEEWKGKINIVKLNSDENPDITEQYDVRGIPTMILFKDGQIVERVVGAAPKASITQFLTEFYK